MRKAVPKLNTEEYHSVFDFILDFYRKLGWDPERHELDPYKIKMHPGDLAADLLKYIGDMGPRRVYGMDELRP